MGGSFQKAGNSIFGSSLARAGIAKQVMAAQYIDIVTAALAKRFGAGASKHARPKYVKQRVLNIEIAHPAVGEEIRLQEEALIAEINERIGRPEIVQIQFSIPRFDPRQPD